MADHDALLERLEDKFTVGDGCWEWSASRDGCGYGTVWTGKRVEKAHRVLYKLLVGPIPDGLELDHLCRNRGCVRPTHLEPVTHAENTRRALNGRNANKAKTHCKWGHPYGEENTRYNRDGSRRCRTCARDRSRVKTGWQGGEGLGARNRIKTRCPRGHPYDEENTSRHPDGSRRCRACELDRARTRSNWRGGEGRGGHDRAKTHCPAGHLYDEENTYRDSAGNRHCRTCRREANRRWYVKTKAI